MLNAGLAEGVAASWEQARDSVAAEGLFADLADVVLVEAGAFLHCVMIIQI